ncbi:MAG: winged helix-turn-helix transcriptional regulator, partial [Lachnospiraceae bacterium]|nr:winged helix-turn-helix transcriptional regulator [Lachnospiraceae bacterium]
MRKKYSASQTAEAMEVLFEPVRFGIVSTIASMGTCRAVDVQEQFDLTQPTMSHHLGVLVDKGVLTSVREGRCVYYSVNPYMMKAASDILISFGIPEEPAEEPKAAKPAAKKASKP